MVLSLRRTRPKAAIPEPQGDAPVDIVPMRRRHVKEVIAIEQEIFPRPWSQTLYLSELAAGPSRLYYVALVDGRVVGYTGCMLLVGEGHITTVGVAPPWQRRGIARQLLFRLVTDARNIGATALTLEVRVTNSGAQELYHSFGFVPAGIRKNYYAEVGEDGLVMWAHGVDTPQYGERLDHLHEVIEAKAHRPGQSASSGETEEHGGAIS